MRAEPGHDAPSATTSRPTDATEVFGRLEDADRMWSGDEVTVEVPGYRADIEREVDLIEEVVRVQGYERVGSTLPPIRQAGWNARCLRVPPSRSNLADARGATRAVVVPVRVRCRPRAHR